MRRAVSSMRDYNCKGGTVGRPNISCSIPFYPSVIPVSRTTRASRALEPRWAAGFPPVMPLRTLKLKDASGQCRAQENLQPGLILQHRCKLLQTKCLRTQNRNSTETMIIRKPNQTMEDLRCPPEMCILDHNLGDMQLNNKLVQAQRTIAS
jgi:hypothetical protein